MPRKSPTRPAPSDSIVDSATPTVAEARLYGRIAQRAALVGKGLNLDTLSAADRAIVECWYSAWLDLDAAEASYRAADDPKGRGDRAARELQAAKNALASATDALIERGHTTGASDETLDPLQRLRLTLTSAECAANEGRVAMVVRYLHRTISRPTKVTAPDGEWSRAMSKSEIRVRLDNMTQRKFETFTKLHPLRPAGNRQLWQIRLDGMDSNTRKKIERA